MLIKNVCAAADNGGKGKSAGDNGRNDAVSGGDNAVAAAGDLGGSDTCSLPLLQLLIDHCSLNTV